MLRAMVDIALKFLANELTTYLLAQTDAGTGAVQVLLSRLVDDSGKFIVAPGNICLTLLNVEEERNTKSQLPEYTYINGRHVVREPDLKLNLCILFAPNFTAYSDALKYLSSVLLFFQSRPAFTPVEYPALDARITKLVVEFQTLGFEQLSQLWTFVGGKQQLSVVYRVRLLVLQPDTPNTIQPPLATIGTNLQNR